MLGEDPVQVFGSEQWLQSEQLQKFDGADGETRTRTAFATTPSR